MPMASRLLRIAETDSEVDDRGDDDRVEKERQDRMDEHDAPHM